MFLVRGTFVCCSDLIWRAPQWKLIINDLNFLPNFSIVYDLFYLLNRLLVFLVLNISLVNYLLLDWSLWANTSKYTLLLMCLYYPTDWRWHNFFDFLMNRTATGMHNRFIVKSGTSPIKKTTYRCSALSLFFIRWRSFTLNLNSCALNVFGAI